jgi:hypothetical protein
MFRAMLPGLPHQQEVGYRQNETKGNGQAASLWPLRLGSIADVVLGPSVLGLGYRHLST